MQISHYFCQAYNYLADLIKIKICAIAISVVKPHRFC